jgi:transposase
MHLLQATDFNRAKVAQEILKLNDQQFTEMVCPPEMGKTRKTLYQWREEVVRMWRFTKNNGITEGFHRKMKLIQRRAYGLRNFENYRQTSG